MSKEYIPVFLFILAAVTSLEGQNVPGSLHKIFAEADAPLNFYESTLRSIRPSQLPSNKELRGTLEAYRGNILQLLKLYFAKEKTLTKNPSSDGLVSLGFDLDDIRYQTQSFHCILLGASLDYPSSQGISSWLSETEKFMFQSDNISARLIRQTIRDSLGSY